MSERSERVKDARKLTRRAGRAKAGQFLAEGPQAVREALAENVRDRGTVQRRFVRDLFVSEAAAVRHADLVATAIADGVPVHHAEDGALASLSETVTPQGVVAVCDTIAVPVDGVIKTGSRLVAVLAEIRDPGNAGTVIRCADAAGAGGVVLTNGSVDPFGGKAVRASAGSVFHLPIATDADLGETATAARAAGMTVIAADGSGRVTLDEAADNGMLARQVAWMFGNEARGMPPATLALADDIVRVPIYGRAESLNLATAAAICLYASARAQRAS